MVAANRHHSRVPQAAPFEDGKIGRAAADIHDCHAEFLLILGQHGVARRELFEDGLLDADARAIHAGHEILRRRGAAGHDVDVDLEPRSGHPHRIVDAVLFIDHEILGQHVQDLASARQADRASRLDGPPHVVARDFPVLAGDRHDTPAVEAFDVGARQAEIDVVDLDAGRQFGFVDGLANRLHGRLDVDHRAAPDALRIGDTEADDADVATVEEFADDRGHLRGADVESDQMPLFASHSSSPAMCFDSP